jgi:hypothetical protein
MQSRILQMSIPDKSKPGNGMAIGTQKLDRTFLNACLDHFIEKYFNDKYNSNKS